MDTSLELIRSKIEALETQIANLRIAERELHALEKPSSRKAAAAEKPVTRKTRKPRTPRSVEADADTETGTSEAPAKMTIGATITEILGEYGALSVGGIADHISTTGRDISNRAISFTLQALKKRGLVKSANGEWSVAKTRGKRARA
jgi:hypothetical protein